MKTVQNVLLLIMVLLVLICVPQAYAASAPSSQSITAFVQGQWKAANIPGITVAVIQNNSIVYSKQLGHTSTGSPVTDKTLFELGSNSKAFTGLAILQLIAQHRLALTDAVSKYLPWFWMQYQGHKETITIEQLLHHTSGIKATALGSIPVSTANNALELTVRTLVGGDLRHKPGYSFEYATINYDILGLIIQQVTGSTYEQYIQDHILTPLGLTHTYVGRNNLPAQDVAPQGYKMCFLHPCLYNAPEYRGNTPAGYIISNQQDMICWAGIQLGIVSVPEDFKQLIQQSHMPNLSVSPDTDGSSYAAGWSIFQVPGGEFSHDGTNPNFSSYIGLLPSQRVGVVILANMSSSYTHVIGQGIINLYLGRDLPIATEDQNVQIDKIATFLICLSGFACLFLCYFLFTSLWQIMRKKRRFAPFRMNTIFNIIKSLIFLVLFALTLYNMSALILPGMPWSFILIWGPNTILYALVTAAAVACLIYLYYLLMVLTDGVDEKPYYWLITFSVISGLGNALIIFVINETFVSTNNLTNGLLFYFVIGIVAYVFGQRFVRRKIIRLTNNLLFKKRIELLQALQQTSYRDFENLEQGKILAGLNSDTEVISNSIQITITGLTNVVTLLCCLLYLGFMNGLGLLVSLGVIICTAGLYYLVGQRAEKLWEDMRDAQNHLFQQIQDLLAGFKELQLNSQRRFSFHEDVKESSSIYRDKRIQGDIRFADVFVIGELLFIVVIGFVAFFYPSIFPAINQDILHNYVFVFLYMTGPVNAILDAYPQIVRMRVSWKRVESLSLQLNATQRITVEKRELPALAQRSLRLEVRNLQFDYQDKDKRTFTLGPIDYTFMSGEIVFITGGNGSGKSTFAKLITGLYTPTRGSISINGSVVESVQLSDYYSAIFSDFYLFEKLYGLSTDGKEQEIAYYLSMLQLTDKVQIREGNFSTTQLSSGQRKRLALLISYLEDRPICLYDEWASDQDPEYRTFFYQTILPDLRAKGKCIIVITHDDRYFHLADKVLKLDMGKTIAFPSVSL